MTEHERMAEVRRVKLLELGPAPRWWRVFARRDWERRRRAIEAITIGEVDALLAQVNASPLLRLVKL